ncbi:MAG: hypothetical protein R6X25_01060 [Candidatus Krumholzibacteriia bacterium]
MEQQAQKQMRLQQIQQQLAAAQQEALAANPELLAQSEALEELVVKKMVENGYDPEGSVETLESVQEDLQKEDLSDAERQKILVDAQAAQQHLQEAQSVVLQDSQFVALQESFREDLMDAMREQEPTTDELIAEFERIQLEIIDSTPAQQGGGR